jgi:N-acetylglutamate synthase-like GNAT family acetyltransferase
MFLIKEPRTPEEFGAYFLLRWQILRKPWNQPKGSEIEPDEAQCIHAMVLNEKNETIGVCRLQFNSKEEAQIRFMAAREDYQRKGVGTALINYLEKKAKEKGAKRIILQARENALNFYLKHGYTNKGKTKSLFGVIQHYLMEKEL